MSSVIIDPRNELAAEYPAAVAVPTPPRPADTFLPRTPEGGPAPVPRPIRSWGARDILTVVGAAVSALCTGLLLFGRLTPLRGNLGFVIVTLLLFITIYAVLTSLTENRPAVVDRVMTVMMSTAAAVAGVALVSVIVYTFVRGWPALAKQVWGPIYRPRWNFFLQDMSETGPLDPLDKGGVAHAIVGSLIIITISLILTVPLSIACAVYLNETRGRLTELVRTVVTAMTALPSIIAGLFIFATWILLLGYPRSGLAAAMATSLMMLPIIVRSADVVLRLVPGSLREAAAALGAPQWRTAWHVVLPTARSGLTTSVILGVARGIGETAPVLLTAGFTSTMNLNPCANRMVTLPLAAVLFVRSPQETLIVRGFATAAVLMMLVLVLFITARLLGGRAAGHMSARQRSRATQRSLADMERIETALGRTPE